MSAIKSGLLISAGFFALVSVSGSASEQLPAMKLQLPARILLTKAAQLSNRSVAVGDRGTIIYSTDGRAWRQANVPTQRLLTTVRFVNDQEGWAGGHDSLVLHTIDGGENWRIQHEDAMPEDDLPKPILDISFSDHLHGMAVGAFGSILNTEDGGNTWKVMDTAPLRERFAAQEREPDPQLNAIIKLKSGFLIVGELGTLVHYDPLADNPENLWRILKSPYEGSFFGADTLPSGAVVIYGLRGNAFCSVDDGDTWTKIKTGTAVNLYGGTVMADDSLIIVGAVGTILRVKCGEAAAEKIRYPGFADFATVLAGRRDELLLFGMAGAEVLPLR